MRRECLSFRFDRFQPDDELLSKLSVTRRAGSVRSGLRTWCHALSLFDGEIAHAFYVDGTEVDESSIGAPVVLFRIGGATRCGEDGTLSSAFGEIIMYPDGRLPACKYHGGTHEFILSSAVGSTNVTSPCRMTVSLLEPIWRLILMLRIGEREPLCKQAFDALMSIAHSQANRKIPAHAERAAQFMEFNWLPGTKSSKAAAYSGVSLNYLCRTFRLSFGVSMRDHLQMLRLNRAAGLLWGTTLQLGEVAAICGFFDQAHLTHAMARRFGITPQLFRSLAPCIGNERLSHLGRLNDPTIWCQFVASG